MAHRLFAYCWLAAIRSMTSLKLPPVSVSGGANVVAVWTTDGHQIEKNEDY
jgi:hypothetical protein